MNQTETLRIGNLTPEASVQMHEAMLNSLKAINEFFSSPVKLRKDLAQEIKVANSVINSFAKIRQAESGHEMVMMQMFKMVAEDKKEFREYVIENLPHLFPLKKLKG